MTEIILPPNHHPTSQADLLDKVSNVLAICELRAKGNGLTEIFQLSFGPRDMLHFATWLSSPDHSRERIIDEKQKSKEDFKP